MWKKGIGFLRWFRSGSPGPAAAAPPATVVNRGQSQCRRLALTFDTEFDLDVTPRLLDVLEVNRVRATFFLVGQVVGRYPALIRRIADHHELGNHTYHHVSMTQIDPVSQVREVRTAESAIATATGRTAMPLFRPPFGDFNDTVRASVGEAGYSYLVHWSIAPEETYTVDRAVRDLLSMVFAGGIILLHAWTPYTPPALEWALPVLRERGYQFVTVGEMLGIEPAVRDWGETPIYVQPGETLEGLGACYNTPPAFLAAYNELSGQPLPGRILLTPHRLEVMIRLNGARLTFDAYPRLTNNQATAPVRTVAEALGARVAWDPLARRTLVQRGSTSMEFTLDSAMALVGGAPVQMPVPAFLACGRTLVPVRFLVETLGDHVGWDASTRTVLIRTR